VKCYVSFMVASKQCQPADAWTLQVPCRCIVSGVIYVIVIVKLIYIAPFTDKEKCFKKIKSKQMK